MLNPVALTVDSVFTQRDIHDLGAWQGIVTPFEWQLYHSGIVDDRHASVEIGYHTEQIDIT